jgi:predicted AlkP superfamily pyrophosphatase or phosphodiesterase
VLDEGNRDSILAEITPKLAKLEGVCGTVEAKDFATRLRHLTAAADPREPDLVLLAADGYTFTDSLADLDAIIPNDPPKGAHGHDHLMPNMYGSCVISGAGITSGKVIDDIQNIDITPTMARLLGIPFPDADGKVIEAAFSK